MRERLHLYPRLSPPEPQNIPIHMRDGEDDDDQPPQGERQRERSRSRERVYPHVPVPQERQIQPMVTPESDDEISDEDFTIDDSSQPSAEQGNRSRRYEISRSSERVYPRSCSLVDNDSLLYLLLQEFCRIWKLRLKMKIQQQQPVVPPPPPGIQQNPATQTEDENSATVDPQNRLSNHSMSPQKQEDTRRQGPETPNGRNTAENQPRTP